MFKLKNTLGLLTLIATVSSVSAQGTGPNYPYNANAQNYQQGHSQWGPGQWMNNMQNQFNGQNNQNGKGNLFQDAKGFYKMMGNGNTKWKFYFDFDFQMEMDARLKAQNRANAQNRMQQNGQQQQQHVLDDFQDAYNNERPHESLGQQLPKDWYAHSEREYPNKLPDVIYPDYFLKRKVSVTGTIYWGNGQIYISNTLKGEIVGMEEVDNGIWDLYFGHIRLGSVNKNCVKGKNSAYWTLKV